jgi:hypothetical protein
MCVHLYEGTAAGLLFCKRRARRFFRRNSEVYSIYLLPVVCCAEVQEGADLDKTTVTHKPTPYLYEYCQTYTTVHLPDRKSDLLVLSSKVIDIIASLFAYYRQNVKTVCVSCSTRIQVLVTRTCTV